MSYLVGDVPAAPLLVSPERDGEPVELDGYASVNAQLTLPDGSLTPASGTLVDVDDERVVEVQLPKLTAAGLLQLTLQLSTAAGPEQRQDTFTAEPVVVEELDGWHTLETARAEFGGFRNLDDARLYVLLATAKRDCVTYSPVAATRRPNLGEREAQLMQARNRNSAARVDPATGDDGVDGYSTGPRPLDWAVKALLRPKRRFGGVR